MARNVRLEDITFTFRCQETWTDMAGSDTLRHCGHCDKDVYDLSALTRTDAETLLQKTRGKICVRMYRTADGRVITADEPAMSQPLGSCGSFTASKRHPRARALWRKLSAGAAAAAVVMQPGSCESGPGLTDIAEPGWGSTTEESVRPWMGDVAWELEPENIPTMGAPVMPPAPEPKPHAIMGRMVRTPFQEAAQPVTLTPVELNDQGMIVPAPSAESVR
jgi:hypothetical protein